MGNGTPFKRGGRLKSLACQSGMVARVWVTRYGPRSHVVGHHGALATAPLAPATVGHINCHRQAIRGWPNIHEWPGSTIGSEQFTPLGSV